MIELAAKHKAPAEVCVAKPGFILGQGGIVRSFVGTALWLTGAVDTIDVKEVAAAMLYQVVHGFEGTDGVISNAEMVEVGKQSLNNKKT